MRLPDGSTLMHGANLPYDPVKAHEYYLKTRKLKGRKKGGAAIGGGMYTVRDARSGQAVKLSAKQLAEQRAYAAKRVAGIKKKLHLLNAALKEKMAEARKAEQEAKKPDTAAEKSKKARESAQYRDKNQQKLKNKAKDAPSKAPAKPATDSVEGLKKTIKGVQHGLKIALERQRSLATATKN